MATLDDFVSFLQGASNSAASNLSAPVDGINWLLGKAGLPVSKAPVGGSVWLRQAGFTAEPKNRNAGLLGEFVGGVMPIVAAAKAPQIAALLNQAGRNLSAPRTLNPQTGAIVWHGSPHKFDKFSMDKIGTGEGAQAYGHGLYLAENKAVAQDYSKMQPTAMPTPNRIWNGVELTPGSPEYHAATLLERSTLPATRKEVSGWIKEAESWPDALKNNPSEQAVLAGWRKTLDVLNSVGKKSEFKVGSNANLYKTDIPDEAVARFLDWDKPLSQQSKEVQAGLSKALAKRPGMTGAELYNVFGGSGALRQDLNTNFGFGKQASETLKELGIPGIRYLDGGSRGAGQGSSNFVVFSPDLIRILERNGQATGAVPWQPGEWRGLLGNN